MKIFKFGSLALSSVLASALFAPLLYALPITSFTSTVGTGATQVGRLSRNSIQQDWLGTETYPGVINTATVYDYKTFTFSTATLLGADYIDVSVYDETNNGNFFLSAYANSYNPGNLAANWLGDEGASGNYFGTDARYFDIVLPVGASLVLVANNTAANGVGNNAAFDITINAYTDANYTDPVPAAVPEPSSVVLLGTGLVGVVTAVRRRITLRA